ncbi:MAG: hypothetical protein HY238_16005 [Acidobacteria bacterium]|nr:hypothetical protein [Acidobacteriota bacterium]
MKLARLSSIALFAVSALAGPKLTFEERTEIVRGLMAEFATVKVALPRSKKPLAVTPAGKYEKEQWAEAMQQNGPAGRVGDLVQITRVIIENDRIVLEINDGMRGKRRWYHNVQVGTGAGTSPIARDQSTSAPGGTTIALVFEGPVPPKKAAELKKMLQPVLDFEKHSATELYTETLPKEVQEAIKANKVLVGMDREMVLLAKGRPENKLRENKDGVETEDWIYGKAPGTITFVTFEGNKVIRVKEMYAGVQ